MPGADDPSRSLFAVRARPIPPCHYRLFGPPGGARLGGAGGQFAGSSGPCRARRRDPYSQKRQLSVNTNRCTGHPLSDGQAMGPRIRDSRDRWRGIFVALLSALFVLSSIPTGASAHARAAFGGGSQAQAEIPMPAKSTKPCKRAVLPGGAPSCSISAAGFTLLPAAAAEPLLRVSKVHWRPANRSAAAQCQGASPYRPPCPVA
jgi:hypothetical protein